MRRQAKVADVGRVLHDAALPARGRARRRRARRLRRRRRHHRQDLRIAELAMQEGCATALVLNKWDVARDGRGRPRPRARAGGPASCACARRVLTASAKTGRNVQRAARRGDRARRPDAHPHPDAAAQPLPRRGRRRRASRRPSRATASSCSTWRSSRRAPPRFSVQVNSRTRVTRDYAYFLENRLRARFGMDGVPLIIDFHERKQRRGARQSAA